MTTSSTNDNVSASHPDAAPRPNAGELVDYEQFIETQLHQTRRQVRGIDIWVALFTLVAWVIAYILAVVVVDHWLVAGGLGSIGRTLCFLGLVAGVASFLVFRVFPLVMYRISPLYAAAAIERSEPSLKNSLVNFLFLRDERARLAPGVYDAIERQAAGDLLKVPAESAIDRRRLIHVGYVLMAAVAVFCLYTLLSPKDPLESLGRLAAPWANLKAPTRVSINDVQPGNANAFHDEVLTVSAHVRGVRADEQVTLYYTTADHQTVDQPVAMQIPERIEGAYRHQATLPPGGVGLRQSVEYHIMAGDTGSPRFRVEVLSAPSIIVERVRYEYPPYTGLAPRQVERQGDLKAIEGTEVTLEAKANRDIKAAAVDFDCDGRRDLEMATSKDNKRTASTKFVLSIGRNGAPAPTSYQLRFATGEGHENPQPIRHQIDTFADQPPEVEVAEPAEDFVELATNGALLVGVRARDPDFALRGVTMWAQTKDGKPLLEERLLDAPFVGPFVGSHVLDGSRLKWREGMVVSYWFEARDNKQPLANRRETVKYRLKVVAPVGEQERQKQLARAEEQRKKLEEPPPVLAQRLEEPTPEQAGGSDSSSRETRESADDQDGQVATGEGGQQADDQQAGGSRTGEKGQGASTRRRIDPESNAGDAFDEILEHRASRSPSGGGPSDAGEQQPSQESSSQGESKSSRTTDDKSAGKTASDGEKTPGETRTEPSEASERQSPAGQDRPSESAGDVKTQKDRATGGEANEAAKGESSANKGEGAAQSARHGQRDAQPPSSKGDGNQAPEAGSSKKNPAGDTADGSAQSAERDQAHDQPTGEKRDAESESRSDQSDHGEAGRSAARPGTDGKEESPRAGETGDGQQGRDASEQPKGNSGQGPATNDQKPATPESVSTQRPRSKKPGEQQGESADKSSDPAAPSTSRQESDNSRAGEQGDRSGGGKQGGGQGANQRGAGGPGKNSSGDIGGADDPNSRGGQGSRTGGGKEAGVNGDAAKSDDGTGGKQASSASGAKKDTGGDHPNSNDAQGKSSKGTAPNGSPSQEQGERNDDHVPSSGSNGDASNGKPGSGPGGGRSRDGGSSSRPPSPSASESGGTPSTGPVTDNGDPSDSSADPNLEYARKVTDLALEHLRDQIERDKPDEELLDRLGWTRDDLETFLRRWDEMKRRAAAGGDEGAEAQKRLDDALSGLGLRPRGADLRDGKLANDALRKLKESPRIPPPREYAEQFEAYTEGTARSRAGRAP